MDWIPLTEASQLNDILVKSAEKPQIIFKHSTRCSISSVAHQRLQKGKLPDDVEFYYLDLISYRSISNKIAELFGVHHESPQVLIIKDGKCIFDESHLSISLNNIVEKMKVV